MPFLAVMHRLLVLANKVEYTAIIRWEKGALQIVYIQAQAERLNIPTPCITFDQPLWLKAVEIIRAKSVCRLGGFHTLMSFMGSIGSMMKGSGLYEALGTKTFRKGCSRALRGHFLVQAALFNKLMLAVLPWRGQVGF